jgi:xanthine phosphoribosyltransferase
MYKYAITGAYPAFFRPFQGQDTMMAEQTAPKRFIVSWDQFHRDCKALAWRLVEKRDTWKGIIAITRGGAIPAGIIARELEIKLVETVCISSYDDKTQRSARILKDVNRDIVGDGDGWLVIDDLVDTGNTAKIIREIAPKAHVATVYAKPAGEPLVDTYVTWVSQDTWIYFPWDVDPQPVDSIASLRKPDGSRN